MRSHEGNIVKGFSGLLRAMLLLCLGAILAGFPAAAAWADAATPSTQTFDGTLGGNQGILPIGLSADNATATTIARLAGADTSLNGSLVTFRGEAVGEPINSSSEGSKWVVLQSGTASVSSIQVLMSNDQVALIENFGAYKMRGSTLQVTGIYRVADPNQTGELDVTAYVVSLVDPGGPMPETIDLRKLHLGLGLVAVGVVLIGLRAYLKWRSRS